jgi:YegS/Rv2252/BmrU family lipid kinase
VSARTLVVVNPNSRNGVTKRRWSVIEAKLRSALGALDVEFTRAPRDAERIAREGVRSGVERIVVAGGDGTLNEVVNGLLSAELGKYASVGLLPLGTGADFARTAGVPTAIDAAIRSLAEGKPLAVDAGRVISHDSDRRELTSYFANIAGVGLSSLVAELVNQGSKALGGRASYILGSLRGLLQYRSAPVSICIDGELVFEGPLVLAAVANGQYFGGGMRVAPGAKLHDGLLDLVAVPELSEKPLLGKVSLAMKMPRLYSGSHFDIPQVHHSRGRLVEISGLGGRVPVDVDGEPRGTLPARIEVLPGALTLWGCRA